MAPTLGRPRVHLRSTTSTNDRARALALAGAPHGTLVTAAEQTAGRGRQGRRWTAPPGSALLMSLVLRPGPLQGVPPLSRPHAPLPLLAGVAVCDVVGPQARVKWPNDVVVPRGPRLAKLAGILTEGRPQEGWAVLGIGVNVAVRVEDLPAELRDAAATLGLARAAIEPTLERLLAALAQRLGDPVEALNAWRSLDALRGRHVSWGASAGPQHGRAEGIDGAGRLLIAQPGGGRVALDAGEVHLASARAGQA